jgi:hypothetical protein
MTDGLTTQSNSRYLAKIGNYRRSGENRGYEMYSKNFQSIDKSRIIAERDTSIYLIIHSGQWHLF